MKSTKRIALLSALTLMLACRQPPEEFQWKKTTSFPSRDTLDYHPKNFQARLAFPDPANGKPRVWVKGSELFPYCMVSGERIQLLPPFYTAVKTVGEQQLTVTFLDSLKSNPQKLKLYPKSASYFRPDTFSIMAYGCFQPFHVDEETGLPVLRSDTSLGEYNVRDAFRKIALGGKARFFEEEDSSRFYQAPLSPALAVLGTGDQTYVDAAYYTEVEDNPMTAWSKDRNPVPLLSPGDFDLHLDRMYRHFLSFDVFEEVFARLPSTAVWDDHEIRDGWGSQGDEYLGESGGFENINPKLKPYFLSARRAYADHMLLAGPSPEQKLETEKDLHQEFEIGKVSAFLMDLRSHRNVRQKQVMGPEQMTAFKKWMEGLKEGQTALILSSIPLFWEVPDMMEKMIKATNEEMRDDVTDSWSSKANLAQRNEIYKILIKARMEKDVKIIVMSGDIHVGAVHQAWYNPDEGPKEVLAYEMVVSGFAHKDLHKQAWGKELANFVSANGEMADDLKMDDGKSIDVKARIKFSAAKLNFGAIEVQDTSVFLNVFFQDNYQLTQLRLKTRWGPGDEEESFEMEEVKGKGVASTFITSERKLQKRVIEKIEEPKLSR